MVYNIEFYIYDYNYLRIKGILLKTILIDFENGSLDTIKKLIIG